jgi:hypothetical protein
MAIDEEQAKAMPSGQTGCVSPAVAPLDDLTCPTAQVALTRGCRTKHTIDAMQFLVTLVLAAGLVWAVVVWKSRRRDAALVAAARALQLAVRLI